MVKHFFFHVPLVGCPVFIARDRIGAPHMTLPRIPSYNDIHCHTDGRVGGEAC